VVGIGGVVSSGVQSESAMDYQGPSVLGVELR
jgi:hypothetical protein